MFHIYIVEELDEEELLINVRLVPENEDQLESIYNDLKQISREYVSESDMNGGNGFMMDGEESSDGENEEVEGQFDDAD